MEGGTGDHFIVSCPELLKIGSPINLPNRQITDKPTLGPCNLQAAVIAAAADEMTDVCRLEGSSGADPEFTGLFTSSLSVLLTGENVKE